MTTLNKDTLKTLLSARINASQGAQVMISQAALNQMNSIVNRIVELTDFDEKDLTTADFKLAGMVIDLFSADSISGNVVNGILQPCEDNEYCAAMEVITSSVESFTPALTLPLVVIAETLTARPVFYR